MKMQTEGNGPNQYFIKGSGTSYCLINGSSQDESEFVPFKFRDFLQPSDKEQNIKQLSMAGLYLIIQLENGKTFKLGSFMNHQLIFKTPIAVFSTKKIIKSVSSGWDHTILRTIDDQWWGLGSNKFSQLSLGQQIKYVTEPMELKFGQKLQNQKVGPFVCGFRQSYFVTEDSNLYGCGQSKKYELGVKSMKSQAISLVCKTDDQIIKLGTAKRALFALSACGILLGIGSNDYGIFDHQQMDMSLNKCPQYFEKLTKVNEKVKDFVCGWSHVILIKNVQDKLRLESYGRNNFGQLGRMAQEQTQTIENQFVIDLDLGKQEQKLNLGSGSQFAFCCNNGELYGWGWNQHQNVLNNKEQVIHTPRKIDYPHNQQLSCSRVWTYPAITIIQTVSKM